MAIFMSNKKVIFSSIVVASIAGIGAFFSTQNVEINKQSDTEQVVVNTDGVVLFSDDKPVKEVSVDADKSRLAVIANSVQMWIE